MPTILVMDDEQGIRELLDRPLRRKGSGARWEWPKGLELFRQARPDLIVLG